MNVNPQLMAEYAEFLEENSTKITNLCTQIEENLSLATQCMDQVSGLQAAKRMLQNLENIKNNVPVSTEAGRRLILSKKYVDSASNVFGR